MSWKCQTVGIYDTQRGRFRKPGMWFRRGVSDILGIYKGKFLAIEVKSLKGRLSLEQKVFIDEINAEGGIAFMARSIEDVESKLKEG